MPEEPDLSELTAAVTRIQETYAKDFLGCPRPQHSAAIVNDPIDIPKVIKERDGSNVVIPFAPRRSLAVLP